MKDLSARVEVVRIEPSTYDESRTYDQYVFLKLSNGAVIDVFDYSMLTDQTMLGKMVSVTLQLFLSEIEYLSEKIYKVSPNPGMCRPPTSGGHCFSGRITAIDMIHKRIALDVGVGEVLVDPDLVTKWDYPPGSFIRACPARVDLFEIKILEEIE